MNLVIVVAIGAALGLLGAAGIYFDSRVPNRHRIVFAGVIRGVLVALLTGFSMQWVGGWVAGVILGLVYGGLMGLMLCLAKEQAPWTHASYIIPASAITGALSGLLIPWLAYTAYG